MFLYVLINSNLLSVHVDSAFSVPDSWQIQMAQQFNYTASLPVTVSSEVRQKKVKMHILNVDHDDEN